MNSRPRQKRRTFFTWTRVRDGQISVIRGLCVKVWRRKSESRGRGRIGQHGIVAWGAGHGDLVRYSRGRLWKDLTAVALDIDQAPKESIEVS